MKISGLLKLTALDYPEKLACTVFTAGCNLRCPFCHNASLVLGGGDEVSEDDFFAFLKKRRGILDGVCITGGEPLLQNGIEEFMKKIKELGFLIKLDTNGAFPDKLSSIIDAKLVDYVAMDIKNCPEKYPLTCGVDKPYPELFAPFKKSISILLENRVDYEFRTTVVSELHTVDDIQKAGEAIRGADKWFLQCFKDSGDILKSGLTAPSKAVLEQMRASAQSFVKKCEIRGV
ncbi:MAG: anaerobic ribonucleoside-triphosphate reductase activating protein [Oscillospiraceae bacterium]|nr:anaerobic ribonucleoside-triphosphate reductase activating protein [Oscillospiraceae bacterium]